MTDSQIIRDLYATPWPGVAVLVVFLVIVTIAASGIYATIARRSLPAWLDRLWLTVVALSFLVWVAIMAQRYGWLILMAAAAVLLLFKYRRHLFVLA